MKVLKEVITTYIEEDGKIKITETPLVRCGECERWEKMKDSYFGYCHAEKHCYFSTNWEISIYRTYKSDHFCSYGERRTNEDS